MLLRTTERRSKPSAPTVMAQPIDRERRLAAMVRDHYGCVWRVLRRFGLTAEDADDAAQRVFMIAASRLADIAAGCERAFLFRTGIHIASKVHRSTRRRPEDADPDCGERPGVDPLPDDLLEQRRARDLLDRILDDLPTDLKAVLVLYEIEELSTAEIADALCIPPGTVASRLRRARSELKEHLARYQARFRFKGAPP